MASISASLAGLVSFGAGVTGIAASYDLKTFFDARSATPPTVVFPCLMAVPELGQQTGWKTLAGIGSSPLVEFNLEHYLLFSEVAANVDLTVALPSELALIDNYMAALKSSPFLTATSAPSTHWPVEVTYRMTKTSWWNITYHTMVFRHLLKLNL